MKNKYLLPILFLFVLKGTTGFSTTHIIVPTGAYPNFMFSPTTISAVQGDTVIFQLNTDHFPIEVDSTTWANNQNTHLSGGFLFAATNNPDTVIITQVRTYYYVCGNHYAMGMKGRFLVSIATGVQNIVSSAAPALEVYPNPVTNKAIVKTNLPAGKTNELRMFDMTGKCVYQQDNVASTYSFDMTAIPSGVYFLTIRSGETFLEKKLIVSK